MSEHAIDDAMGAGLTARILDEMSAHDRKPLINIQRNRYMHGCSCGWIGFPHSDHRTLELYTMLLRLQYAPPCDLPAVTMAQLPSSPNPLIWIDHRRMGGTPCVHGTRVPLDCITDLLDDCDDAEINWWFPAVTVEQVSAIRRFHNEGSEVTR